MVIQLSQWGIIFLQKIAEKLLRLNTHLDTNKEDLICSLIFIIHPSLSVLSFDLICNHLFSESWKIFEFPQLYLFQQKQKDH